MSNPPSRSCGLRAAEWRRRSFHSMTDAVGASLPREPVAHAVHGEDELGVARVGFHLLSQPRHMDVDRARGGDGIVAPHIVEQLFARERCTAMFDEVLEELK